MLVMNVVAGIGSTKKSGYTPWPQNHAKGVVTEVSVAEIGPELVALLEKHGQSKRKTVGFPLTIHFMNNIQGDRQSYRCSVQARGKPIAGALLSLANLNPWLMHRCNPGLWPLPRISMPGNRPWAIG